jgi:hypothetical protein
LAAADICCPANLRLPPGFYGCQAAIYGYGAVNRCLPDREPLLCHNNPISASFFAPVANRHSQAVFLTEPGHLVGLVFYLSVKQCFYLRISYPHKREIFVNSLYSKEL